MKFDSKSKQKMSTNEYNEIYSISQNILNWYPFEKSNNILQIGINHGELTKMLCERTNTVTSICIPYEKDLIVKEELDKFENLALESEEIQKVIENKKYDYILIIGNINEIINQFENIEDLFLKLHKILDDKGKILIALDNPLGIQNWNELENNEKMLEKVIAQQDIEKAANLAKFNKIKYYYPLPNYSFPNVIYTDDMLPDFENITRDLVLYNKDSIILDEQVNLYKLAISQNEFKAFANSYLIEISKDTSDNQIKFVSFSNLRKSEYRIKTIIQGEQVYKSEINEKATLHIENIKRNLSILKKADIKTLDEYKEGKIISKYCNEKSLNKILIDIYLKKGLQQMLYVIEQYKTELMKKLEKGQFENNIFKKFNIEYNENEVEQLSFIKHGLWDLIFQNCFYINDEFYFYDQEWYEENIPIEFIMYRSIVYFSEIKKYVSEEELLKRLDLYKYKNIFDELDRKLQEQIRNNNIWQMHIQAKKLKQYIYESNENKKYLEENLRVYKNDNQAKQEYIERLEKENKMLKMENDKIINSKSWKITKPIREITKRLNQK